MNEIEQEDPVFTRVREMLVRKFGVKSHKIKPESRIREDLGICGDDGLDLFEIMHKEFNVDLAEYQHEQHFEPEAFGAGAFVAKSWWTTYQGQKPITVAQLVEAVRSGKWKEEHTQHASAT